MPEKPDAETLKRWRWGRSGRGHSYQSKQLCALELPWIIVDLWLIRYSAGSSGIPPHVDEVPGKRHWRINLVYQQAEKGGELECEHALINWPRLAIFRSDRTHSVSPLEKGIRRVLSLGIAF